MAIEDRVVTKQNQQKLQHDVDMLNKLKQHMIQIEHNNYGAY